MATMEKPSKSKKTKKKETKSSQKYESLPQQPELDIDCGDCDHLGSNKSPATSAFLLTSSVGDIDNLLRENQISTLPGTTDSSGSLSSEQPLRDSKDSQQQQQQQHNSNRRNSLTAAFKRSFSGFARGGGFEASSQHSLQDVSQNNPDNHHQPHQHHQRQQATRNFSSPALTKSPEKPTDVHATVLATTTAPLKSGEPVPAQLDNQTLEKEQQMLESLQSLRDVCLRALDQLLYALLQTPDDHNSRRVPLAGGDAEGTTRTVTEDHGGDDEGLLRSIYLKANRLAEERTSSTTRPNSFSVSEESSSTSTPMTAVQKEKYLFAIQERLDACAPSVPSDDYTLTVGLASLLNGMYHIMGDCDVPSTPTEGGAKVKSASDLFPSRAAYTPTKKASSAPLHATAGGSCTGGGESSDLTAVGTSNANHLLSTLRQHVARVQNQRTASEGNLCVGFGNTTTTTTTPSTFWSETDRLMELVASLLRDRFASIQKPNGRSSTDIASLPSYGDIHSSGHHLSGDKQATGVEKKEGNHASTRLSLKMEDISSVLSALDRVMEVVPRMNNQRVDLSDKQERALAAASLSKAIVRLSKGRLEGQRAGTSARQQRMEALDLMIDRISRSAKSQLDDQRVSLTEHQTKNLELAKITGVLDKASKKRLEKQEWQSPRQIKDQDMNKLNRQLQDTVSPELENHQRYKLTANKEKELFMANIMGKMNRLSDRRMEGQDATSALERKHEKFREIDEVMDRMRRGLDEQKFCRPSVEVGVIAERQQRHKPSASFPGTSCEASRPSNETCSHLTQ